MQLIRIPIEKQVVSRWAEMEVPAFRKVDEDCGAGETLTYFYKFIDARRTIKIARGDGRGRSTYYDVTFHNDTLPIEPSSEIRNLPKDAILTSIYTITEEEFNQELRTALADWGMNPIAATP